MNENSYHNISASPSTDFEHAVHIYIAPLNFLSSKQRKNIVATWMQIHDKPKFGQCVYSELFKHQPQLQAYFPFRDCPQSELERNAAFQSQGRALADFLDFVVGFVHLDAANFISDASTQIGRRHAERLKPLEEVPIAWWNAFADSTLHCLKPYYPKSASPFGRVPLIRRILLHSYRRAWKRLLTYVVELMRKGYRDYRQEERTAQQESAQPAKSVHSNPPSVVAEDSQRQLKQLAIMAASMQVKQLKFENERRRSCQQDTDEEALWDSSGSSG